MKEIQVLENEKWLPIKDYEDIYQVSDHGRIRGLKGLRASGDNGAGYRIMPLNRNGGQKMNYVHRLVAKHFIPNPDDLSQVNHKDGNKSNNHIDNLEWVSPSQNINDAHNKGQMVKRTREVKTLNIQTDDVIRAMYLRYKQTGKVGETAREFGIPRTTLSSIVNKRCKIALTDQIDKEFEKPTQTP